MAPALPLPNLVDEDELDLLDSASYDDGDIARQLVAALQEYERALNAAQFGGFDVEPRFQRVRRRLPGVEESYVARTSIVRRAREAGFPSRTDGPQMAVQGAVGD